VGKVKWTREASRWLKEIRDYIALDNPVAALKTVQGIYRLASTLSAFPQRGYRFEEVSDREIRVVLYGHYRIAYLVKSTGDVNLLGVFHGALDMGRFLTDLANSP
jgi:plasmid stabilization system protein ParE